MKSVVCIPSTCHSRRYGARERVWNVDLPSGDAIRGGILTMSGIPSSVREISCRLVKQTLRETREDYSEHRLPPRSL